MNLIPRADLRGQLYSIHWHDTLTALGGQDACGFICRPAHEIAFARKWTVEDAETEEALLDTLIHEMLHACFPDASEDSVTESAVDIARALYRIGTRIPGWDKAKGWDSRARDGESGELTGGSSLTESVNKGGRKKKSV